MKAAKNNKIFLLAGLILIIVSGLFFLISRQTGKTVCDKNVCFHVEIAKTEKERETGLMNRSKLDLNKGMLFVFDSPGKYSFWMKNTLIPLDMIWIDRNKKIVDIKHDAKPCQSENCETYSPKSDAKYVLEINAGAADSMGIKIGGQLKF